MKKTNNTPPKESTPADTGGASTEGASSSIMAKPPAFQFYANDFMDATRFWSAIAVGLYVRCLCIQWTQGSIPSDVRTLAKGVGMDFEEFEQAWRVVSSKFEEQPDGSLKNRRLEDVRSRQEEVSSKRSEAGRLGAIAKANASANGQAKPEQRKVKEKIEGEIEEEVEQLKISARESKQRADESFARFWAVYARKEGKQAAVKAWTRLTDEDRAEAEKRAKSFCAARDPAYLPHPATYLNGRRWEDADPPKPAPKAVNGQPALMSRAEAMEALRKIRAQHGIPVGGFIEAHLIPDEVNKALR